MQRKVSVIYTKNTDGIITWTHTLKKTLLTRKKKEKSLNYISDLVINGLTLLKNYQVVVITALKTTFTLHTESIKEELISRLNLHLFADY